MRPWPDAGRHVLMKQGIGLLRGVLGEGFRALFLRRVRWPRVSSSGVVACFLLALVLGLTLGLDRLFTVLDTPLTPQDRLALDGLALRLLVGEMALTIAVVWIAFRHAPVAFLNVSLALNAWQLVLSYALWGLVRHRLPGVWPTLLIGAFSLWYLLALGMMLRRGYGGIRLAWLRTLVMLAPLCVWSAMALRVPGPSLWKVIKPERHVDTMALEEVFELQRDLLAQKVAALLPQRPDVPEYYFISFAPDGSEAVFRRELDVIQPLVDQRLETWGRSLRLRNSAEGLRTHPVATVANLKRAIEGVAGVMDRDKDVLMMYLTAHGSRGHFLSADLSPMQLLNLTGARLRGMLDAAGIRNRVIVISACYSGGFISSLAHEDALIITASDAEHPSFGCGNESDFTYFGRAFFQHGLSRTVSPTDAFKQASPLIAKWERELGQGFSNPQMSVGSRIDGLLKNLDQRLSDR